MEASAGTRREDEHRLVVEKNIMGEFSIELEKRFSEELAEINCPVILDLSATTMIDSRGVALCVGLFKECQRKKLPFSIEVNSELSRFFKLLKLDRVLQFIEKENGK